MMNIGYKPVNVEQLKKSILHQAFDYNMREQQVKHLRKNFQREKQIEECQLINKRVVEQLNQQKEREISKKYYIRNILSQEYQKQMQERRILDVEQKRRNRSYAYAAEESQREYHEKRARELARIYRAQKTFQTINPEAYQDTQSKLSRQRIATEASPSYQRYYQQQIGQQKMIEEKHSIPTELQVHESPKSYKDYLKQEIERKRQKKEEQIRNRMEIQKELAKYNSRMLTEEQQKLKQIQRKQQQAYKIGLDQQIAQKKSFKNFRL